MQTIALMTATPLESKDLRHEIRPRPGEELKTIFEGGLHGKTVIVTHSGVGKVNAAHSATLILENYDIDLMILYGIGGAYAGCARIGDVVVAVSENYGEEGVVTQEGWNSLEFMGFPFVSHEREYYNTFPLDGELVRYALKTLKDHGFSVSSGNFVTVSQVSGTRNSGNILRERFHGICENTEGAAAAHICTLYEKPLLEIRGISNIIEDRDKEAWNIPGASSRCCKAVIELIRRMP